MRGKHARHTKRLRLCLFILIWGGLVPSLSQAQILPNLPHKSPSRLVTHIGTTDGKLETQIAAEGIHLVHGLTTSESNLTKARKKISDLGLVGLASVQQVSSFQTLPYADNLVDVLIADLDALKETAPSMEEILRVLVPQGQAHLKSQGQWKVVVKPLPDVFDEWTHWDHGPDGNPASQDKTIKPTTSLQWLAGPTQAHRDGVRLGIRIVGGRVFYTPTRYELEGQEPKDSKNHLVCRNAFNGLFLWEKAISQAPGRFGFIADKNHVYGTFAENGPLEILDAKTGQLVNKLDRKVSPPPLPDRKGKPSLENVHFVIRVFDGKVLTASKGILYLSDAKTGKILWSYEDPRQDYIGWAIVGENKIFAAAGKAPDRFRGSPGFGLGDILALDATTGKLLWRNTDFNNHYIFRMVYHKGHLVIPFFQPDPKRKLGSTYHQDYLVAKVDASNGQVVWQTKETYQGYGHYQVCLVNEGRVYVGNQKGFSLDFQTGKLLDKHVWAQYDAACADLRCVPDYVFYGLTFIDEEGKKTTRGQARSICDTGVFPAYGMMYTVPSLCLCSNYVNGYLALASEPHPLPVDDSQRLVRGHTKGTEKKHPPQWPRQDEWPIHMGTPQRSSATKTPLPAALKLLWQKNLATYPKGPLAGDWKGNENVVGVLSAPTVAENKIFVAIPDAHRVEAHHAQTGETLWSFTANGRIDSPPTIYDGKCLFGSRDGWVYCLQADDGKLVWKFLAALNHKKIIVHSQLESAWPVLGSVMIHKGEAVVTAGRQSALDGGIQVYRLDPHTGTLLNKTRIWTDPDSPDKANTHRYQPDYRRVQDLLVSDGQHVYHSIDKLKNRYEPKEVVDLVPYTASNRGGFITRTKKRANDPYSARDITVLWANASGFLSRRTETVGRWDFSAVAYSNLFGHKIVLDGDKLYRISRSGYGLKFPGLTMFTLDKEGRPAEEPTWRVPLRIGRGGNYYSAMILADDQLILAGHKWGGTDPFLDIHSTKNGEKLATISLPALPVRDGLAIAHGKLFVSCQDGTLLCLGE